MNKNFLAPAEIVESAINIGVSKANRRAIDLLILGVLAGAFIALAAQASNMAAFNLLSTPETYGMGRALAGFVFSVGLMLVVTTGAELFTGNTLMCVSVYEKKITLLAMLRNWVIVYIGNFIGAICVVLMVQQTGLWGSGGGVLGAVTVNIAVAKISFSWIGAFFSGLMCNWLVCLAVWISFAADTIIGKLFGAMFPIFLFVTSGFDHSIANMYYVPAGILAKGQFGTQAADVLASLNWGSFITANLIPVTLGNIVGGVLCVGTAYWFTLYRSSRK